MCEVYKYDLGRFIFKDRIRVKRIPIDYTADAEYVDTDPDPWLTGTGTSDM